METGTKVITFLCILKFYLVKEFCHFMYVTKLSSYNKTTAKVEIC